MPGPSPAVEAEPAEIEGRPGPGLHPRGGEDVIALARIELRHLDPVTARERRTIGLTIDLGGNWFTVVRRQPAENLLRCGRFADLEVVFRGFKLFRERRGLVVLPRNPEHGRQPRVDTEQAIGVDGRARSAAHGHRGRPGLGPARGDVENSRNIRRGTEKVHTRRIHGFLLNIAFHHGFEILHALVGRDIADRRRCQLPPESLRNRLPLFRITVRHHQQR